MGYTNKYDDNIDRMYNVNEMKNIKEKVYYV